MFRKPHKVKSNTQLKGSERKKIRTEILKNFPTLTEEDLLELIPQKETMTSTRIYTNSGESVIIYSVTKYPIILHVENIMYPTVFMLWQFPDVIPTFTTLPPVFPRLVGGADLMLPGVVLSTSPYDCNAYGQLEKGDQVAVNLTTNRAAFAVGEAVLSSEGMYQASRRGKALKIIHHFGDHIWALGSEKEKALPNQSPPNLRKKSEVPIIPSEDMEDVAGPSGIECELITPCVCVPTDDDVLAEFDLPKITESIFKNDLKDLNNLLDVAGPSTKTCEPIGHCHALHENDDVISSTSSLDCLSLNKESDSGKCGMDTIEEQKADMDRLVQFCFLKALKSLPKSTEYPLLVSTFYKLYMIPACPSDKKLDFKKSSYKKLSKFLAEMQDVGIVQVRELSKGVESIIKTKLCHPLVMEFVDPEKKAQHVAAPTPAGPKVCEMYAVTAAVLPLFTNFSYRKGTLLSGPDVRKYLTIYVKERQLQDERDPSRVILDDVLRKATGISQLPMQVPWPELIDGVTRAMTRSLQLTGLNNSHLDKLNPAAGNKKVEPIDIQVATRSGNKKVTLVYNLELFGINLAEFGHTCQHGVAASTSIKPASNRKGQQVLIQGNHVNFVGHLLQEKYEIPKRYIKGLDLGIKPKK